MSVCEKCKLLVQLKTYQMQTENMANTILKLEQHHQIALHQMNAFQQDKCNLQQSKWMIEILITLIVK